MPGSKILVVDDEKVIADSLKVIFAKEGYDCRAVYSAEEAIEAISMRWVPDLAIVDVILPSMTGVDLAILLKSTHPSILVMLISGQLATGALVENAAERGFEFKILPKPMPVTDMLANASKMLSQ
jgi:DNA-binding NtrC family response regulator